MTFRRRAGRSQGREGSVSVPCLQARSYVGAWFLYSDSFSVDAHELTHSPERLRHFSGKGWFPSIGWPKRSSLSKINYLLRMSMIHIDQLCWLKCIRRAARRPETVKPETVPGTALRTYSGCHMGDTYTFTHLLVRDGA